MLPCQECPTGEPTNPEDAHKAHGCWLNGYSQAYRDSTKADAEVLMNQHLIEDYGTTNKAIIVALWLADPLDIKLQDGRWGYAHAALSLIELQGLTGAEAQQKASDEIARWYLWEAKPRCEGVEDNPAVAEWQNTSNWYEDSFLDYWTPLLFIEWYLGTL